MLRARQHRIKYNVHLTCGSVYTFNLVKCYNFFDQVQRQEKVDQLELRNLVSRPLKTASGWMQCIEQQCAVNELVCVLFVRRSYIG